MEDKFENNMPEIPNQDLSETIKNTPDKINDEPIIVGG